uniref:non-specific serine/threonine protein kinase n=1 Tax=Trichuris muris TaxID=70415 RepID=A0A5S6QCA5_TRIMR
MLPGVNMPRRRNVGKQKLFASLLTDSSNEASPSVRLERPAVGRHPRGKATRGKAKKKLREAVQPLSSSDTVWSSGLENYQLHISVERAKPNVQLATDVIESNARPFCMPSTSALPPYRLVVSDANSASISAENFERKSRSVASEVEQSDSWHVNHNYPKCVLSSTPVVPNKAIAGRRLSDIPELSVIENASQVLDENALCVVQQYLMFLRLEAGYNGGTFLFANSTIDFSLQMAKHPSGKPLPNAESPVKLGSKTTGANVLLSMGNQTDDDLSKDLFSGYCPIFKVQQEGEAVKSECLQNAEHLEERAPSPQLDEFTGPTKCAEEQKCVAALDADSQISTCQRGRRNRTRTLLDKVLGVCNQTDVIPWEEALSDSQLSSCMKIGEGSYCEVFLIPFEQHECCVKVIPMDNPQVPHKMVKNSNADLVPEILISLKLRQLCEDDRWLTPNLLRLHKVRCVRGRYPTQLITAWDKFAAEQISENDRPHIFEDDQHFVLLYLEEGGVPLDRFKEMSVKNMESIIKQAAITLGILERVMKFEHRDLHVGNVLVKPTKALTIDYIVDGKAVNIPSAGVVAYVVDFTLSRLAIGRRVIFSNISSHSRIFDGYGDAQFDVYRAMRELTKEDWQTFSPMTNVLWVKYLINYGLTMKYGSRILSKKAAKRLLTLLKLVDKCNACDELLSVKGFCC